MDFTSLQSNKILLADFYAKHDASKAEKVDEILKAWPLAELQEALRKKYGEAPSFATGVTAATQGTDDDILISSDDEDLVVVSALIKKPKKKKKDKKNKKDKVRNDKAEKTRKPKKAIELSGTTGQAPLPAKWGQFAPPVGEKVQKWWAQAVNDIESVKRRLTQQAMKFVDEAVRRKLDEKMRRAAELREVKAMGKEKREAAVMILDDDAEPAKFFSPSPERYAASDKRRNDIDLSQYTGPGRAESEDELDDEERGVKVGNKGDTTAQGLREVSSRISSRKPSEKEQMSKALEDHFAQLEQPQTADGETSGGNFASFESFDARKAHAAAHGIAEEDADSQDSGDSSDSSEDDEETREKRVIDYWGSPPEELLARANLEDSADGSRAFVAHFVRYGMGAWSRIFSEGRKIEGHGLTDYVAATFNSSMVLEKTKEALTPLLVQLQRNTVSPDLLQRLDKVATLAAQREYARVMEEYVVVTMGRKTWYNSHMQTMMQQNHGGSVAKILKQSEFIDFDYDPTLNAYMMALKRLIQFLQWLRPAIEPSRGVGI